MPACISTYSISGNVLNDAGGLVTDSHVNGTGTNAGGTLYVSLVNSSNAVVATVAVAADGTYTFPAALPGNYTVVLHTTPAGSNVAALQASWATTGEDCCDNTGNDAVPNGIVAVTVAAANITNANFGIEQLPNSDNHSTTIPQPNVGTVVLLNGGANPPVLSGIDPEDCTGGCNLSAKSIVIDAVPSNSELYYNGVLVTNGQQINNFNPNLLEIRMTAATIGATSTSFQYSYLDQAGKKDPTPATYTLNWLNPLPITLSSFTGIASKCDAVLQWKTSQEINADRFVVEQNSNGLDFTAVAEIKSTNSSTGNAYQTSISQPAANVYYRLKMLDKNGKFSYSPIVLVRTNCSTTDYLSVYPNPVRTNFTLSFHSSYKGQAILQIVNEAGQQLAGIKVQISSSANRINLDMSNFVPGLYMLSLVNELGEKIGEVQKVIKK